MQLNSKVPVEGDTGPRASRSPGLRAKSFRTELPGENESPVMGGVIALMVTLLASCANPAPPSGGPRDTTPPSVVQTRPVRDTVNVPTNTERLRIEFSEYIERSSLPQALSVTPTFERRPRFDWSGRSVEIEFPEPLRDSTTYIFSFDTNLRDVHGVSLENPIRVAFSTGPKINRGLIQGRVVAGREGGPRSQVDVYAYALSPLATAPPSPLPAQPRYRTQTGEEGRFTFDYMREQRYYVVALQDHNRNRQPDALEPFAVPPRLALRADSGASEIPVPWLLTRTDTIAPALQGAQSLSRRRVRASFDEPVQLETRTPAAWAPRDSATGTEVDVQIVYADPDRADAVVVRTASMRDARYILPLERGVVADTAGQELSPDTARFQGASRADTVRTRVRGFLPADPSQDSTGAHLLLPTVQPGIRFNQAPDSAALRQGLSVRDTTGRPQTFSLATENGTAYRIQFDDPLAPGQRVDVRVAGDLAGADTTYQRQFRHVPRRLLGGLEGRIVVDDTTRQGSRLVEDTTALRVPAPLTNRDAADTLSVPPPDPTSSPRQAQVDSLFYGGPVVVELTAAESSIPVEPRRLTTSPDSTFVFRELPEGQFRFRAYLDRDGNGQWDGGRIQPYVPAEPVGWIQEPVESRPRWTTAMPAPLRLPVLAPVPVRRGGAPTDTTRSAPEANP